MNLGMDRNRVAVHSNPAWGEQADFVVLVDLSDADMPGRWEQLWVRRVEEGAFQLCCIPFFAYGLALGDVIEASRNRRGETVAGRLLRSFGHSTVRIAVNPGAQDSTHEAIHAVVAATGAAHEWKSGGLLALDVPRPSELATMLTSFDELVRTGSVQLEVSAGVTHPEHVAPADRNHP